VGVVVWVCGGGGWGLGVWVLGPPPQPPTPHSPIPNPQNKRYFLIKNLIKKLKKI